MNQPLPTPIFDNSQDEILEKFGVRITEALRQAIEDGNQTEADICFLEKAEVIRIRKGLIDASE